MLINKKRAYFFLVCNGILTCIHLALYLISISPSVFKGLGSLIATGSPLFYAISGLQLILKLLIYTGIIWILNVTKEKLWIRAGFSIFFASQVLTLLIVFVPFLWRAIISSAFPQLLSVTALIFMIYVVVCFSFLSNKNIKGYLIAFAALTVVAFCSARIAGVLYDNFSFKWLFNNQQLIVMLPTLATLVLFIDTYKIAKEQNISVNEFLG